MALIPCRTVSKRHVGDTGRWKTYSAVLEHEQRATEEEAVHDAAVGEHCLEWLPKAQAHGGGLVFDGVVNGADLLLHVDVVRGQVAQPAEILDGFLALATLEEPSGRLLDQEATNHEETGRNDLNGKGDDPLGMGGSHGAVNTVVDPLDEVSKLGADLGSLWAATYESDKATNLPGHFVQTD